MNKWKFLNRTRMLLFILSSILTFSAAKAQELTHAFLGEWNIDSVQAITSEKNYFYFITNDTTLNIADVSNPVNPQIVSQLNLSYRVKNIRVQDDLIMLLTRGYGFYKNSLILIDVSNKTSPEIKTDYSSDEIFDIVKYNNYFILSRLFADDLVVLDGSDLTNLVQVNTVGWTGDIQYGRIILKGTHIITYFKDYQMGQDATLKHYSIADLPELKVLQVWPYDDGGIKHFTANRNIIFVVGSAFYETSDFQIYSIFNNEYEKRIDLGVYETTNSEADLDYLYLLSKDTLLTVYNITNLDSLFTTFKYRKEGQAGKAMSVNGNIIYVLSHQGKVFVFQTLTATDIANQEHRSPSNYLLYQNYPNPFNSSTSIKFKIAKLAKVKLVIYNLQGREVMVVLNKQIQAGFHEIKLDASNLSTGVYYYSLSVDNITKTKKFVLLK